jgi:hypothetical protein
MDNPVELENIEQRRCSLGIEDVELREAIRGLRVGDYVKVTILTGAKTSAGETLVVRITRIRGSEFRGKLADGPPSLGLAGLRDGAGLAFTANHIHSLLKGRQPHED